MTVLVPIISHQQSPSSTQKALTAPVAKAGRRESTPRKTRASSTLSTVAPPPPPSQHSHVPHPSFGKTHSPQTTTTTAVTAQGLAALPPELLDKITASLPRTADVANLSATARGLSAYAAASGWRVYVRANYAAFDLTELLVGAGAEARRGNAEPGEWNVQGLWADVARALGTLEQDWSARAMQARCLDLEGGSCLVHVEEGQGSDGTAGGENRSGVSHAQATDAGESRAGGGEGSTTVEGSGGTVALPYRHRSAGVGVMGIASGAEAGTVSDQRRHYPNSRMAPSSTEQRITTSALISERTLNDLVARRPRPVQPRMKSAGRRQEQTIGFSPALDSYETLATPKSEQYGRLSWADRREVLAVGAGAELQVRVRETSSNTAAGRGPRNTCMTYTPPGAVQGRDDVTAVQLLGRGQASRGEKVVVGTAVGQLQCLDIRLDGHAEEVYPIVAARYNTGGKPVRSAVVSKGTLSREERPLAAILGHDTLALWDTSAVSDSREASPLEPTESIRLVAQNDKRKAQAWRTSFLSPTTLATTFSSSPTSLKVYTLRPDGLGPAPSYIFPKSGSVNSQSDQESAKTIYPVEPLPATDGRLFVSGGHDGVLRLHDMRTRRVAYTSDTMQYGPIYSLLPRANNHILAGAAQENVLHVIDLRTKAFLPVELSHAASASDEDEQGVATPHYITQDHSQLDTMTESRDGKQNSYSFFLPSRSARPGAKGPVYALSAPSLYSTHFYAGLENTVLEFALARSTYPTTRTEDSIPAVGSRVIVQDATEAVAARGARRGRRGRKPANMVSTPTTRETSPPLLGLRSCEHGSFRLARQVELGSYADRTSERDRGGVWRDERWRDFPTAST